MRLVTTGNYKTWIWVEGNKISGCIRGAHTSSSITTLGLSPTSSQPEGISVLENPLGGR